MTVAELIEKLKDCPPESIPFIFRVPIYKDGKPASWEPVSFILIRADGVFFYYE